MKTQTQTAPKVDDFVESSGGGVILTALVVVGIGYVIFKN